MIVFVVDACIERWRRGGAGARREVLVVVTGVAVPMAGASFVTQLAVLGSAHIPVMAEPWFVATLAVMAFQLSGEITTGGRTRLELTKLQAEFAQVGRVTALGQLASALAHELAQPLTAIGASVSAAHAHLERANPSLTELRSIVTDIGNDDRRAGEVLERMRALIRRRSIERQPLVLDEVVQSVVSLVHAEAASRHVALECVMQPGLPRVLGDRVHVSQVLLNLIINGMDSVQACPIDARRVVIESRADQATGGVETSVQDCGPGISDLSIEKVFDPLFTTKPDGMGMGLTISRTIVESLGGRLWAEHGTQGRGATFRFTLPRA